METRLRSQRPVPIDGKENSRTSRDNYEREPHVVSWEDEADRLDIRGSIHNRPLKGDNPVKIDRFSSVFFLNEVNVFGIK